MSVIIKRKQRSDRKIFSTYQVNFGFGTPAQSTDKTPFEVCIISKSVNGLVKPNAAVTLTLDAESTLPSLFLATNV